jgi:succinyl-CoA synthetase beta subunit
VKIHEFQAKQLMAGYGIAVPESRLALTAAEAGVAFDELGVPVAVVKAQIHAGGRGKGGGVQLVKSRAAAEEAAAAILAQPLVTHQTGPAGQPVKKLLVEAGCDIDRELYVGIVLDRSLRQPVMMASTEGGMEIEEVAAKTPEKIRREPFDANTGLAAFQSRSLAFGLGLSKEEQKSAVPLLMQLSRLFLRKDCSLVEINPLVVTKDHRVIALDGKVNFDGNGLFRHKDLLHYRDRDEEDPREAEAGEHGLSWVSLDGDIGCMVNGAGLAMATMDAILLHGGRPANFLDVGGGATADQVREAFKLILRDDVRAILVNIFGGIAKCDVIADGILQAAREVEIPVPLVVRLEGTNVEIGRAKLDESGLALNTVQDMDAAARTVVEKAQQGGAQA